MLYTDANMQTVSECGCIFSFNRNNAAHVQQFLTVINFIQIFIWQFNPRYIEHHIVAYTIIQIQEEDIL